MVVAGNDLITGYRDALGNTLLHYAAYDNNAGEIECYVDFYKTPKRRRKNVVIPKSLSVDVKNDVGETPLYRCAYEDCIDASNALIVKGADVNAKTRLGFTATIQAIYSKSTRILKRLIEAGADPFQKDAYGFTYFHHAFLLNDDDILELVSDASEKRGVWARINGKVNHFNPDFLSVYSDESFYQENESRDQKIFDRSFKWSIR